MIEVELKLGVPESARDKLLRALFQRAKHEVIALRARYFDTPTGDLESRQAALRVRQERGQWIQTFKAVDRGLGRIEISHEVAGPELELERFKDTPAWPSLQQIAPEQLICLYETDIERLQRRIRHQGALLELAMDQGEIRAGSLSLPVHELEIEQVQGPVESLLDLARQLIARHGLLIDPRSKAERGARLAQRRQAIDQALEQGQSVDEIRAQQVLAFWAPTRAEELRLPPVITTLEAAEAVMLSCLGQIQRNALVLADLDGANAGQAEHLHQLRVGIRRLRTAWKVFAERHPVPEALLAQTRQLFAKLGAARDADVLLETIVPRLQAAGMPQVVEPVIRQESVSVGDLLRSADFQVWICDILAHSLAAARVEWPLPGVEVATGGWCREALLRLLKQHTRIIKQGKRLARLSLEDRHALRKRIKAQRYLLEFAQSLLDEKGVKRYRSALAKAQEALGDVNDLAVALEHYQRLADRQPEAWFAVGWCSAHIDHGVRRAQDGLTKLAPLGRLLRIRKVSRKDQQGHRDKG